MHKATWQRHGILSLGGVVVPTAAQLHSQEGRSLKQKGTRHKATCLQLRQG